MAPRENALLRQIVAQQAVLSEKFDTLDQRMFGGPGQDGAIPILFQKHDKLVETIQRVKDEAASKVDTLRNTEIKDLKVEVSDLKTDAAVSRWKTGTISALAGSGVGIGVTMIIKKLFGIHS